MFVDMFSECDGGTYGADCRYHCGHCLDKQQCDVIDGSCLNGCGSGYSGAKCTESNYANVNDNDTSYIKKGIVSN